MTYRLAALCFLFIAMSFGSLAERTSTSVADIGQEWAGYWNAKNLRAIMTLYAEEPVFLPTSGERWSGAVQIRRHFDEGLKQYDPHLVMHSVASSWSGNLAYDSGTYEESVSPVKGGREVRARGNYLILFTRVSRRASWKILEQIWTEFDPAKL